MARKRRESFMDQSAEECLGNVVPANQNKFDNIEVGLSIDALHDMTKDLMTLKAVKINQLMDITENDKKRALLLSNLHKWQKQSAWLAGRLLTAIKDKIQTEFNAWSQKGEKPEKNPCFITFKAWIQEHENILDFGERTATNYIWLYNNIEFEKAALGTKKLKIIKEVQDPDTGGTKR